MPWMMCSDSVTERVSNDHLLDGQKSCYSNRNDLNTDLNNLSTKVLSKHCISKEINSVACLACIFYSKTTYNSVFIDIKNIEIGCELTSG